MRLKSSSEDESSEVDSSDEDFGNFFGGGDGDDLTRRFGRLVGCLRPDVDGKSSMPGFIFSINRR